MAKGLGKGLNSIFPDHGEEISEIHIKECRPNPYQPRKQFSDEAIDELKQSIQEHGILQPIIVRKSIKGYEIVVGERRYRAAKEAELEKIPALIRELTDDQMMELALLENLQREDLTPIEEAWAYQSLIKELGLTQDQLAARLGKSRSHIANLVRLLSLPSDVMGKINEGTLSMGHGRALLGLKDKGQLPSLVNRIEKEGLNVRQVERMIAELNDQKPVKKKQEKPVDLFLKEQEETLTQRLGTGVTIHKGKKKGKIEIEFFNDEDLERLLHWFEIK
ncbi:ParB/RepB/Spo0J family partition protein [Halobacillus salinarum]|uniref:ParB/RepB/Spo0J family partition protein n=1 Tax=Halobacillus salinarum TaxID=2932257 RepID=A0ABY4EKS2_9BACI|nr:ParB/RepB/Spo0J family partition protein [Halobacillus salinarum]UOQ44764.1 ParB/RepB/Spo0J family partition protein [Halobacillus salinarum]